MSHDDYRKEALRQLGDVNFYSPCNDSFTRSTSMKLQQFLKLLYKRKFINLRELRFLSPPDAPRDRQFYILPKVRKSNWPNPAIPPGRPIISDVSSVSRNCASFIEHFLAPIARSLPSYVTVSYTHLTLPTILLV